MELCDLLGRKHLGGPGRADCAGDVEIKDHASCVTRSAVVAEAEKGRKTIVARCFAPSGVKEARSLGIQLIEFKRLPFGKKAVRIV
jgi:hypothetical protein